jgi:prepilin-type processing-associated H-X9-DG protein
MSSLTKLVTTAIPTFNCPSRRVAKALTTTVGQVNVNGTATAAKSDYAANCGCYSRNEIDGGPGAGSPPPMPSPPATPLEETGISYRTSKVRFSDITDGSSHVIAVGEKYLPIKQYETGTDAADNENMYVGYDNDITRSTHSNWWPPYQDNNRISGYYGYGSAHPSGFNAVFCDGSVHVIAYNINATDYCRIGDRRDGDVVRDFD